MNEAILDVGTAYEELRPHLLRALAKLARQGFSVSPWDGLDLIHDFFLEAWDGINSRYDPSKGTFEAYVYAAFVHFVRPRIVRLRRLQSSLVEPEQFDLLRGREEQEGDEELYVLPEDSKQVVREAVSRLPPREREILSRYLYADPRAERMLARKFSLSRYGLRQTLVDALGQVTVRLDKPGRMPERDWKVALALWRDRRTIDETAAYLGLTPHQVRGANSRNVHLLTEALKRYHPAGGTQPRRNTMRPQRNLIPPHDLLERVIKSPGNEELLGQVRERAEEVLAVLENSESFGLSEEEMRSIDPLWVAEVYEAMAAAAPRGDENSYAAEALFNANQEEEASIGTAFRETLLADLPEYLLHIERWFPQSAPRVDEQERRELIEEPSVQAGMPCTAPLVPYGVTPLTVFYATEAVSSLLDRLMRYEMIRADVPVALEINRVEVEGRDSDLLNVELLVDEIERVTECDGGVARGLYSWSVQAAQYKPFLFGGFRASPRGEGVCLARTEDIYDNLFQRWGLRNNNAAVVAR